MPGSLTGMYGENEFLNIIIFFFVLFVALFACSYRTLIKVQLFPAFAYPAAYPGRIAHHQGKVRHVFRNYAPGAYESIPSNVMPANDGCIGSDGSTFFYNGLPVFILPVYMAPGVDYICENTGRPQEYIILTNYAGIQRYVVLYLAAVSYFYSRRNHNILSDVAAVSDAAAAHDMRKMPDFRIVPDGAGLIHIAGFMYKVVLHILPPCYPKSVIDAVVPINCRIESTMYFFSSPVNSG